MPNIDTMIESKYLKKEDVGDPGDGTLVTIQGIKQGNVAKEDDEPEMKWLIKFVEFPKPMVLNPTNMRLCALILNEKVTEKWTGKTIEVFHDPSVSFGDKLVGGIRFRKVGKTHTGSRHNSTDDFGSFDNDATSVTVAEQEIRDACLHGTEALKTAWGGLSDAAKDALRPNLAEFKKLAASPPPTRATNVDSFDDEPPF